MNILICKCVLVGINQEHCEPYSTPCEQITAAKQIKQKVQLVNDSLPENDLGAGGSLEGQGATEKKAERVSYYAHAHARRRRHTITSQSVAQDGCKPSCNSIAPIASLGRKGHFENPSKGALRFYLAKLGLS